MRSLYSEIQRVIFYCTDERFLLVSSVCKSQITTDKIMTLRNHVIQHEADYSVFNVLESLNHFVSAIQYLFFGFRTKSDKNNLQKGD